MGSTAPILELEEITKSFGAVRALKGVSFDLRAGEVHALLGENGAGKSTLIKVVTGAHAPDGGSMRLDGKDLRGLDPASARRRGIACIYQQPALFPDLTVAENLRLRLERPQWWRRVDWAAARTRAAGLLERIGASISVDALVSELSMPEQQLVEIACALGSDAKVVVMDEPTASLTRNEQELLYNVVRGLRADGVGVVYISHRLEEIFALADRVTVLRDGESIATRPVAELDEAEMIALMVGREVSQLYPARGSGPGAGVEVLGVKSLECSSSGVHGVNFSLRAGEVFGMAGLVGAGRTELARALFGITPTSSGEIFLGGKPVKIANPAAAVAHGIAYVPEDRRRHGVILEMAIAHNMSMAVHARLFPSGILRERAEDQLAREMIRDLEIKTSSSEAPGTSLSGGNQQKVSLARWLATRPRVLILDEPTQGVDVGAKSEIHAIIRRLADAEGLAVLMISSDLTEILGMSDRIGVMRGGTLVGVVDADHATPEMVMSMALGPVGEERV